MIFLTLIGLALLILIHELGHFLMARYFKVKVEEFGFGLPPRLFYKKGKETIYSFNLLPLGGFVRLFGEDDEEVLKLEKENKISQEDLKRSFFHQPIYKRFWIISAGVIMNILLAFLIFSIIFMIGVKQHLIIVEVLKDTPAEKIGLKANDIILQAKFSDIVLSDPIKAKDFISLVEKAKDEKINLKIQRGKEILEFEVSGKMDLATNKSSLGIALVETGFEKNNFFKSIFLGLKFTVFVLKEMFVGFYYLIKLLIIGEGGKVLDYVSGPLGVFMLSKKVGEALGFVYFLQFLALISLNLAFLNFLPFPALDGGRAFLLLIEKLKNKALSMKFQIVLNTIGFIILISLIILVTIRDVNRFL